MTTQARSFDFWMLLERLGRLSWLKLLGLGVVVGLLFIPLATAVSPWLGIVALVGLCIFMAMVRRPELGLYLTALVIPMERLGRFTDDKTEFTISLMRVVGLLGLAALLLHNLVQRKGFVFGVPFWWYAAYATFAFLSITYTTDTLGSIRAASTIFGNLLFFFMVVNLAQSRRIVLRTVYCWLFASLLAAGYSTWDWHLGSEASEQGLTNSQIDPGKGVQSSKNRFSTVWQDRAELEVLGDKSVRRSMGPTSHAAVYGMNLIMTVPFFFFLLRLPQRRLIRLGVFLSLGLILYNVLLTNTRAVILLAGVVVLLTILRRLFVIHRNYVVPGLLLVIVTLLVTPHDIYNRALDVSNYSEDRSASLRIRKEYLLAGFEAVQDHFLIGQGVGNQNIIPRYLESTSSAPEETTVHNEYLQTLMEVGIIGWGSFFTFVLLLLRYSFRAAANFQIRPELEQEYWFMVACQLCMISVLVFGVQVDIFHFPLKGWWLIAGLTFTMYHLSGDLVK